MNNLLLANILSLIGALFLLMGIYFRKDDKYYGLLNTVGALFMISSASLTRNFGFIFVNFAWFVFGINIFITALKKKNEKYDIVKKINLFDYYKDCQDLLVRATLPHLPFLKWIEEMNQMKTYRLEENWDVWEHEIIDIPEAKAEIDETGRNVIVEVYVKMTHWIGNNKELAQPVTHAMGFRIPIGKMWTVAEGCETPIRHCNCSGRFPCGEK